MAQPMLEDDEMNDGSIFEADTDIYTVFGGIKTST